MAATKAHSKLVQQMTEAGSKFLENLSSDQKNQSLFRIFGWGENILVLPPYEPPRLGLEGHGTQSEGFSF